MNTKQKYRWVVDAALFASFIVAFMLDWTGLASHQWIGLGCGLIAVYHLATHRNWVSAATRRFFNGLGAQAQINYLVDATLLASFVVMLVTGLVISTWFNLTLGLYEVWRSVHIASSLGALFLAVVKIGLHWRWIAHTARAAFTRPAAPTAATQPVRLRPEPAAVSRRDFLKVMGITGAASALAFGVNLDHLKIEDATAATASATESAAESAAAFSDAPTAHRPTRLKGRGFDNNSANAGAFALAESESGDSGGTESSAGTSTNSGSCQAQCNRGCSYPGHCRRYTDSNGNNLCDLGECL